jgi:hypothetical protein
VRRLALVVLVAFAAGCGSHTAARSPVTAPATTTQPTQTALRCAPGEVERLGSTARAYAAFAPDGAVAYRAPGGAVVARFGAENVNDYPTLFGILAKRLDARCRAQWYEVQLPIRPNGATGWVRAADLQLHTVRARVEVDISERRLTLFRAGRPVFSAAVAVGSPATPTPTGRYYVNQRLVSDDAAGPYGPAAIGVSAFSPVLTGWAQGGPVAIHGTNEPWSIGHAVSNGCIRLPNATLSRLFRVAVAGTPVIIHA